MSHFTQSFCKKMSHFARHGHKKMCQILLAIVGPVPKFWGNGERGMGNGEAGWKKFRPRLSCTAPRPSATLRALPRGGRWCRHIPRSSQNCAGVTMKFAFGKCFMLPVTSFASPAIAVQ